MIATAFTLLLVALVAARLDFLGVATAATLTAWIVYGTGLLILLLAIVREAWTSGRSSFPLRERFAALRKRR